MLRAPWADGERLFRGAPDWRYSGACQIVQSSRMSADQTVSRSWVDSVPGLRWLLRVPRQLLRISPFAGDSRPSRVPLFAPGSGRPTLPFPHPWNYDQPIRILETYFWGADDEQGPGRHNRYLDVPGFAPVLVTRDPRHHSRHRDRNGRPRGAVRPRHAALRPASRGRPARTRCCTPTGRLWKRQRKLAASPFGKTTLFQPEQFHEFAETFRHTVAPAAGACCGSTWRRAASATVRVALEPEIKAVMLEMLANNFFGAEIPYERDPRPLRAGAGAGDRPHRPRHGHQQARHPDLAAAQLHRGSRPDQGGLRRLRRADRPRARRRGRRARACGSSSNPTRRTRPCAATSRCSWPGRWRRRRRTRAGRSRTWRGTRRRRRRSSTK